MSHDSNSSNWFVIAAAVILGLLFVGGLLVLVGGWRFMTGSTVVTSSTLVAPSPPAATTPLATTAAAPSTTVMLIADPADPTRAKEMRFNGTLYAPDSAGYQALIHDLMAMSGSTGIELVAPDTIAAGEVMKVTEGLKNGGVSIVTVTAAHSIEGSP